MRNRLHFNDGHGAPACGSAYVPTGLNVTEEPDAVTCLDCGPRADREWLRRLFEFELCAECGGDADAHVVTLDPIGHRHASCLENPYTEEEYYDGEASCTSPHGHQWERTGTMYGGEDPRWGGEGRCLCIHCGADGDA